ncbi:MAG: nicotinate-nucleotide--dimethylbenzimidazole phosphoribosyltransferase [Phycisphaerae bacterium]|nr:nicotinate-nucleotide--dimethylbenzimidazole phosphoribosyltransferase [Saprospiraceae bacterium]
MNLKDTIAAIKPLDRSTEAIIRAAMDNKSKPRGSLGRLEEVGIRMSMMQGSLKPRTQPASLVVFAADHGVAAEGVSAFPAEVTPQMVLNFLGGGAAINVLCRMQNIRLRIADMGVNFDFAPHPDLLDLKVRKGSRNMLQEAAMTHEETLQALENGIRAWNIVAGDSPAIVAVGEMGIGNSTAAAAIIAAATGRDAAEVSGRGTGIDDAGLAHKVAVIRSALALHKPDPRDGLEILRSVGGLEIAGIAGFVLGAAAAQIPIILDGLIATSGGLIAALLCPATTDWLFSGHRSVEKGQAFALDLMGLEPLLDLGLRLGEGTGAALALTCIDAGCRIMTEMASFADAGVATEL